MTIDELIELAAEAREDLGGDAQVRIAYQPGYPLRAALQYVTVPYSTDPAELYGPDESAAGQQHDGTFLWLVTGDLPDRENPYAPQWAWLGSYFTTEEQRLPVVSASTGLLPLHRSRLAGAGRSPARRPRQPSLYASPYEKATASTARCTPQHTTPSSASRCAHATPSTARTRTTARHRQARNQPGTPTVRTTGRA
jgi:hypothetical protein